jgi:hypothetical protein
VVTFGRWFQARTQNGLKVELTVSFNYRFKPTIADLSSLYIDYGDANAVETVYLR